MILVLSYVRHLKLIVFHVVDLFANRSPCGHVIMVGISAGWFSTRLGIWAASSSSGNTTTGGAILCASTGGVVSIRSWSACCSN